MAPLSGYGPGMTTNYLNFDSKTGDFGLWEMRLYGHLRTQKLYSVIEADDKTGANYAKINGQIFDLLTVILDDFCLRWIRTEAITKGRYEYFVPISRGVVKLKLIPLYRNFVITKSVRTKTSHLFCCVQRRFISLCRKWRLPWKNYRTI